MSQDPRKNMEVLRHFLDTMNENDTIRTMKELGEILTEDYVLHDPSLPDLKPGRAAFLEFFEQSLKENANHRVTVDDMFGLEDKVVTRGIYEYTDLKVNEHRKMMMIVISRFEDGKLAEEWGVFAPIAAPST